MSYSPTSDQLMFAVMRLVLACSGLLIIWIDPSQPDRFVPFTYAVLLLYTFYSLFVYLLALTRHKVAWTEHAHWADVSWYSVLIALSSGTNSIFFFGYLFAILVAAFRRGFTTGLAVALSSAGIFTAVSAYTANVQEPFALNSFLLRPFYLLVLGTMISYLGGTEIRLRRRNELLKETATLSNARFGVDKIISATMLRLCAFFDAGSCLVVTINEKTGAREIRRLDGDNLGAGAHSSPVPAGLAERLMELPSNGALLYRDFPAWLGSNAALHVHNSPLPANQKDWIDCCEVLTGILDADAFLSAPLAYWETTGRIYLTGPRFGFHPSDVEFLMQVVEQLTPVIDNVRLVDRLASTAAEEERQRIARDIHDSIIQPYIGLQIGLGAVLQSMKTPGSEEPWQARLRGDLDRLLAMTATGIEDLRGYVRALRDAQMRDGRLLEGHLLAAAQRFAATFGAATGITVHIEAQDPIKLSERIAAEAFQMIVEGLSNIRRHTQSHVAVIGLNATADEFTLHLINPTRQDEPVRPFTPRSIAERAAALDGSITVEPCVDNSTVIAVRIPL